MTRMCMLLFLLCWAMPTAHGQAYDNTIYVVNNTTTIYTLNTTNGATTAVGNLLFSTSGMARDPVTGRIYYASTNNSTNPQGQIAYWNPSTGTNTLLNVAGAPNADNIIRMAFDSNATLYGLGTSGNLYTINTATGAYTTLGRVRVANAGNVTIPGNGDMAFDVDGTLYAVADSTASASNTSLYRINVSTLSATEVGTTVVGQTQAALAVGANGKLYSGGRDGGFYDINRATGAGTLIANTGFPYFDFASMPKWADLSITKTLTGGLAVGQNATYTITVSNAGPQSASGPITVSDTLPGGLTYVSASGTGWTCSAAGSVVTCTNAGPLANGASSSITLTVAVGVSAAPNVTNTATVSSTTFDPTPGNNSSTVTKAVVYIRLTKSVSPGGTQPPGTDLTYTVTFDNLGGVPASSFVITDLVPLNTQFKIGSMSYAPGTSGFSAPTYSYFSDAVGNPPPAPPWSPTQSYTPAGAAGTYDGNVTYVRWAFTGSLPVNTSGSVSFTVRIR